MEEKITLKDLTTQNKELLNVREVENVEEIAPRKPKEDPSDTYVAEIFGSVDKSIDRIKQESINYVQQVEEEEEEEKIQAEIESEQTSAVEEDDFFKADNKEEEKTFVVGELDDDDFKELDDEDDEEIDEEKELEEIKVKIKEKVKPVNKIIDLKAFTVAKSPVAVSTALKMSTGTDKVADWILPAMDKSFEIKSFAGYEINKLNPSGSSSSVFNTYKAIYGLFYDHIVDANKPATVEEWVKLLRFSDNPHLYFGAYKATFEGVNFIPYTCPTCNETFMSDNIEMDKMVKYKDDEVKAKMKELLRRDTNSTDKQKTYEIQLEQVSDNYVVGLREPSLYNVIFENAMLDDNFRQKYADLLNTLAYVDTIYVIDRDSSQLLPIELKTYPKNMTKTIKERILKYGKILKSLSSDQIYELSSKVSKIEDLHDEIEYVIPECTCKKCGKKIEEQTQSAESLLFTRHQLRGIANS